MGSQRPSFAKRDREMKLKDKAKAKAERRAARNAEPRASSGPPIATAEEVNEMMNAGTTDTAISPPKPNSASSTGSQANQPRNSASSSGSNR